MNELEKIRRIGNYLSVAINLKTTVGKKMKLRVTDYSQSEYLYILSQLGLTKIYKIYKVKKDEVKSNNEAKNL